MNERENNSLICVDAGTTNTRVWLTRGDRVLARAQAGVGVRDTARDKSPARLHKALRDLIAGVRAEAEDGGLDDPPVCVVAAGMITSPLGLVEVPHVSAPAGIKDLAAGAELHNFPSVTELPFLLIPGVRSGPRPCDYDTVADTDVMRGEETLCVGLGALGHLSPPATLLNLGSHWKLIRIDENGCIAAGLTSMSGELIHTTQTQTILASSVPQSRPAEIFQDWFAAGMRAQRQSGLARALFCVRLLEQGSDSLPEQRLSFLLGAYVAADMDAMLARAWLQAARPVTITGGGCLAEAWRSALAQHGIRAVICDETAVEQALLAGLRLIARASQSFD